MDKTTESIWDTETGIAGLIRNRTSGRYYSRIQINGERTMKALKTDVWTVAKIRHAEKMAEAERTRQRGVSTVAGTNTMGELLDRARTEYAERTMLAARSKEAFRTSLNRLELHWPKLFGVDLRTVKPIRISGDHAKRFANYLHSQALWRRNNTNRFTKGYGSGAVNKTMSALHRVLRIAAEDGIIPAVPFTLDDESETRKTQRVRKLDLPSSTKIRELFAAMREVAATVDNQTDLRPYLISRAAESADLAEFMAYSGARVSEARAWIWEDDRDSTIIIRGTKSEGSTDRTVPKIPALCRLLADMRQRRSIAGRPLRGRAFKIKDCREALTSACRRTGVPRLTHHSLRHLFATICIESGVDIPTLSRWMGHSDGGVLAMKTYGHLRQEHSIAQAAKVTFNRTIAA